MTAQEGKGLTPSSIAPAQYWLSLTDASGVKDLGDSSLGNLGLLKWNKTFDEAEGKISDS